MTKEEEEQAIEELRCIKQRAYHAGCAHGLEIGLELCYPHMTSDCRKEVERILGGEGNPN